MPNRKTRTRRAFTPGSEGIDLPRRANPDAGAAPVSPVAPPVPPPLILDPLPPDVLAAPPLLSTPGGPPPVVLIPLPDEEFPIDGGGGGDWGPGSTPGADTTLTPMDPVLLGLPSEADKARWRLEWELGNGDEGSFAPVAY